MKIFIIFFIILTIITFTSQNDKYFRIIAIDNGKINYKNNNNNSFVEQNREKKYQFFYFHSKEKHNTKIHGKILMKIAEKLQIS